MKIEIWSDVVCPWCYIGKRRLENALKKFEHAKYIEIEYKSYQLDPEMETDTTMTITKYLSDRKGISEAQVEEMNKRVMDIATEVGLEYHLENIVPLNTLQAHGLLHFAKANGKQAEMKERLMKAYFTENLILDDTEVLAGLAAEICLEGGDARKALTENTFKEAIQKDINEGAQFGIRGVPFFVFNRTYGISGAQSEAVFLNTIQKSYEEWRRENPLPPLKMDAEGDVCSPDGACD